MNLLSLVASLTIDTSDYDKGLKDSKTKAMSFSSTFKSGMSKLGSAVKTTVKGITVGMTTASAAVVAVGKKALDAYANYEQLVGGVETLFKDSADIVQGYAANAYKTAGLSANEYMETVTGFSASLLQSLNGDTEKAAKKADMAITDMADNANKMGTSIESIQTAYQGFAKQNYTMLDNLKLGYGGTKEEMERLLEDATKLSGIKYDVSSYADIVDAIHVVQTEMGITGTTAKEASTTISGSIASAKSAWQNLITGLADDNADLDKLINNFFDSIVTVGENILPRISVILNGIVSLVEKLAPKIIKEIPKLINQLLPVIVSGAKGLLSAAVSVLPQLAKSLIAALPSLISSITEVFKGIVDALPRLMETITSALPTLIPQIITSLVDMTTYLLEHIGEILQPIIDNLPDILISIVNAVMDNLPRLIEGATSLVLGIVDAMPQVILGLLDALPTVIESVISGLLDCLPQLIEGAIEIVGQLLIHLPEIIGGLVKAAPRIIGSIASSLVSAAPKLWNAFTGIFSKAWEKIKEVFAKAGEWFGNIFSGAWDSVKLAWGKVKEFFQGIWDGITGVFKGVGNWFKGIFSGAWDGIKEAWGKVKEFFQGIWDGITGVFKGVGNWFKGIFEKAVSGIKTAWGGIKTWFKNLWEGIWSVIKTPINWIIKGMNTIIDGINSIAIDIPDWIPGIGGQHWGFNLEHIPELARGGVVNKPTFAMFGEDGAEAVVPLEKNTGWIKEIAKQLNDYRSDTPSIVLNVNNPVVREEEDINKIANAVSETLADRILRSGMSWGGSYA